MKDWDRQLGFLFHDVARFRSIIFDQMMLPHGLTRAQWWVLANLYRKDGLTQTELAERMDLGTVTLSGLIDRLEARGWVERRPDPRDRRAKQVWLTPKVKDVRKNMTRRSNQLTRTSLQGLSDDEIEKMIVMLRQIRKNLIEAVSEQAGADESNDTGNGRAKRPRRKSP